VDTVHRHADASGVIRERTAWCQGAMGTVISRGVAWTAIAADEYRPVRPRRGRREWETVDAFMDEVSMARIYDASTSETQRSWEIKSARRWVHWYSSASRGQRVPEAFAIAN